MSRKKLSNPFSTGGGGILFEAHVQAAFVTLMITGGAASTLDRNTNGCEVIQAT
ncbi:hypothetical protein I0K01_18475 [Xanthomonas oryzae pv. oryzae]|uniref:hypothetical protein n=1 Tax=Xanthomonas oryzae TaxID=347 RepID=UPI003D703FB4